MAGAAMYFPDCIQSTLLPMASADEKWSSKFEEFFLFERLLPLNHCKVKQQYFKPSAIGGFGLREDERKWKHFT